MPGVICQLSIGSVVSDPLVYRCVSIMTVYTDVHTAIFLTLKVVVYSLCAQWFVSLRARIITPCHSLVMQHFVGVSPKTNDICVLGIFASGMARICQNVDAIHVFVGDNFFKQSVPCRLFGQGFDTLTVGLEESIEVGVTEYADPRCSHDSFVLIRKNSGNEVAMCHARIHQIFVAKIWWWMPRNSVVFGTL